jgi:hypothetical protein
MEFEQKEDSEFEEEIGEIDQNFVRWKSSHFMMIS